MSNSKLIAKTGSISVLCVASVAARITGLCTSNDWQVAFCCAVESVETAGDASRRASKHHEVNTQDCISCDSLHVLRADPEYLDQDSIDRMESTKLMLLLA